MEIHKQIRIVLFFAACLFVAKPFIGFGIHTNVFTHTDHPTILLKSFNKLRLDSLGDTEFCKDQSKDIYPDPFLPLAITIAALLSVLYSAFRGITIAKQSQLSVFNMAAVGVRPTYIKLHQLNI
ncbi:hypothetical protein CKK33_10655 [Mucilaginibacter sp. MD40]|uniref:hypothetical protein n=1 Tax=Mucilaginibacter sp. MD40 TaxID=2029590 RepID=UPI000BAC6EA6|nr:hypothetical protein [Mucilaginibacter sp. MD40]PAW93928.1 hypothetical protein CKK33_10655 [Mucilaginibacter sp. MD40]